MYHSLMLLAGMLALFHSPVLPGIPVFIFILCLALCLWCFKRQWAQLAAMLVFGTGWAGLYAHFNQFHELPVELVGKKVILGGCLEQARIYSSGYQRVLINVEHTRLDDASSGFKGRVSLARYTSDGPKLEPGWCGQFDAVLKPVHGTLNERGFDAGAWSYVHGIRARGTLKQAAQIHPGTSLVNRYHQYRQALYHELADCLPDSASKSLLVSLSMGERQLMTDRQWQVLRRSGTSHLLAISGLHIGLVFWFTSLFAAMLWRWCGCMSLRCPAQKAGWITGLCLAGAYLALTGLPLSGRRAWVMLAIAVLVLCIDEQADFRRGLVWALVLVLLAWPASVLSAGFWFSFAAVALILLQFSHTRIRPGRGEIKHYPWFRGLRALLAIQVVLSLSMLPLALVYFGEMSLVSVLANLFAIPAVSFVILPSLLSGLVLLASGLGQLADVLFAIAQFGLDALYRLLEMLVALDWAWYMPRINHMTGWLGLLAGIFTWLFLRDWPGRWMLLVMPLTLFLRPAPSLNTGEFDLEVLDVGQGLAVWLHTREHNLLVDTGFGAGDGFNYVDAVIVPVLAAQGVSNLDRTVISHEDADHAGGLNALMVSPLEPGIVYRSLRDQAGIRYCRAGETWQWDGIDFEFVTTTQASGENNQSCVLKITSDFGSVLLPGDIEREAERVLAREYTQNLAANILVAPHHGSKTSSTRVFLNRVNPKIAIFSTGYLNRYGHPADEVRKRYRDRGARLFNTACDGAVRVKVRHDGITTYTLRNWKQSFWRHRCE